MHFIHDNLNVVLMIAGLLFAAVGSIVEKLAPEHRRGTRATLITIAIVGFVVTAIAAYRQELDSRKQKEATDTANKQIGQLMDPNQGFLREFYTHLARIEDQLHNLSPQHGAVTATVPSAVGAEQYFVQIAADRSREPLEPYVGKLQRKFNLTGDFVGIVDIPSSTYPFRLAFGQHLDKATAMKYAGIANNLNLPPPGQTASVQQQPQ